MKIEIDVPVCCNQDVPFVFLIFIEFRDEKLETRKETDDWYNFYIS